MIRIASPGPTGIVAAWPAGMSATTRSAAGASAVAPSVSAARSAYPSIAVFANGGTGSVATIGSASTSPRASVNGTGTGSRRGTARRTSAWTSSSGITERPYASARGAPSEER